MRRYLLFLLLPIFTIGSCQKEKSFEFTLYLNYNASVNECKTFKISIDGQQKLNDQLCFEGITPCFKVVKFQIKPGMHDIVANASGVDQLFQKSNDFISEKTYGYLDYNQETTKFDFILSSTGGID